ncbi:MAG TPA: hypothetical protein VGI39_26190 [Polyangiaceae bacterium]|jgi:hypothetical protein
MAPAIKFTVPERLQTYVIVPMSPRRFVLPDDENGPDLARFHAMGGKVRTVEQISDEIDDASLIEDPGGVRDVQP